MSDMAVATKKKSQNKGLGRGLDALLGDAPKEKTAAAPAREPAAKRELPIEHLTPNKDQPRKTFTKESINELAASILARGLLQPILVRPLGVNNYEIVAGERRWRAAQKAKLHNVPVIIRKLTDQQAAEISLIENVQRVDLNPVEEARAYQQLAERHNRTQDQISKAVGKSRSHVANIMRLVNLPGRSLEALSSGEITMGHARALLGCSDPDWACAMVLKNKLSVRDAERLVRDFEANKAEKSGAKSTASEKTAKPQQAKDADTRALENDLAAMLGLEVEITHKGKGAGAITVTYRTLDQLDDLCRRLMGAGV